MAGAKPGVARDGRDEPARVVRRTARARCIWSPHKRGSEQSSARVVYASGEQFTNELLAAIRSNRTADFKARYRRDCDLLVLEDIHFVRGKRQTQLELLHTLESLAQRGARVLLTAERLPKEIPDLDARLASRMASGLCAVIETPDAGYKGVCVPIAAACDLTTRSTGSAVPAACAIPAADPDRGERVAAEGPSTSISSESAAARRSRDRSGVDAERRLSVATAFQTAAASSRTALRGAGAAPARDVPLHRHWTPRSSASGSSSAATTPR
jgi:hypothetical protein